MQKRMHHQLLMNRKHVLLGCSTRSILLKHIHRSTLVESRQNLIIPVFFIFFIRQFIHFFLSMTWRGDLFFTRFCVCICGGANVLVQITTLQRMLASEILTVFLHFNTMHDTVTPAHSISVMWSELAWWRPLLQVLFYNKCVEYWILRNTEHIRQIPHKKRQNLFKNVSPAHHAKTSTVVKGIESNCHGE